MEAGAQPPTRRSRHLQASMRGKTWCQFCKLEVDSEAYHCEDCEVCIEDYDHHCVFFSKCIGGGNILCFWASIGGVLFNFINIAIMLGMTAAKNGGTINDSPAIDPSLALEASTGEQEAVADALIELTNFI
mmetsp:Transcript_1454/g.1996  ORF Transcript_1454/g.1996 Transcript_1454/m.1996 type:complete len:131 (+) Transcript_1454:664-1056(+)|eukprot:CAMPEP_0185613980 /NCGR_PEP_ID=MMETSP0436-20130131/29622_1 /TAXON_ID=626734 ORGANISM="Favella taraikaensis, Strain Fe Narragansett Bay" /NCGR_SAMPLE_ID=MMETSP0436 /ASSEMBLY_ACC=CAM_ASM_000390 /LENGTH=130 /DNA_ID=CAMNT_0028248403 /DNA_START=570 /DNA_END=962 /DNA_ORIENTATION=+